MVPKGLRIRIHDLFSDFSQTQPYPRGICFLHPENGRETLQGSGIEPWKEAWKPRGSRYTSVDDINPA